MTSRSRRGADLTLLTDDQIRRVRRGGEGAPLVTGYKPSGAERARAIPGDQKFPYFKDVPDLSGPFRYRTPIVTVAASVVTAGELPQVAAIADLEVLPSIDVRGYQTVIMYSEYFPDDGELIMVPDGAIELPEDPNQLAWFPTGVLDSTIFNGSPAPPTPILNCGGIRYSYANEIRMDGSGLTPDEPCPEILVYDVSPFAEFRMRVGDTGAQAGLNLLYQIGR